MSDQEREELGRLVRGVWIVWANEQPSGKPRWLTPWEGLTEPERDVDRRIGAAIATHVRHGDRIRLMHGIATMLDTLSSGLPEGRDRYERIGGG